MKERSQEASTQALEFQRVENFTASYANSMIFEASAWDLKVIFGQLDQAAGAVVKQHLAVTIPWPQAKLAIFWLRFHVETAEAQVRAKIPIRQDLVPQELPRLTDKEEKDPAIKRVHEIYQRLREEFLASL